MKNLESLRKKELIELITKIRPKADAYDRVCKEFGIENNILGFVKNLTIPDVVGQSEQLVCKCGLPKNKKGGNYSCMRTDCDMTIAN